MPRKKQTEPGVGRVLLRQRFHRSKGYENAPPSHLHSTEETSSPALESALERNDLDELLHNADLAGRDFSAARGTAHVILDESFGTKLSLISEKEKVQKRKIEEAMNADLVTIPRRPFWNSETSAEELDVLERQSFLEWRRKLASLEDNQNLVLTPFEKNLDIWRQLWRVLERSDLIVTVVDGRNPLLYRCEDMEAYVKELDPKKRTLLLINKADLLPLDVRQKWSAYFAEKGIGFHFWSAKSASENSTPTSSSDSDQTSEPSTNAMNKHRILSREKLLSHLEEEAKLVKTEKLDEFSGEEGGHRIGRVVVGFVGYPNVGKSSTINALVGQKKAGVTSTPGKTKHFQTLMISETLMLCDCPGLVFPSFAHSKAEMVASGVIPIDRLTDQRGPMEYVAKQITREQFARVYGFRNAVVGSDKPSALGFDERYFTGVEILRVYARSRGYVSSSGLPDETRASRNILKDYLNGKLLHFHLPPQENAEEEDISQGQSDTGDNGRGEMSPRENLRLDGESGTSGDECGEEEIVAGVLGKGDMEEEGKPEDSNEVDQEQELPSDGVSDVDIVSLMMSGQSSAMGNGRARRKAIENPHKMHKKAPRKKDRSWRVGKGDNDDSDGMPIRVVQKPLSHGAANFATVLPSQRHLIN